MESSRQAPLAGLLNAIEQRVSARNYTLRNAWHTKRGHAKNAFVDELSFPWAKSGVTWPVGSRLNLNSHAEVERADRQLLTPETVGGTTMCDDQSFAKVRWKKVIHATDPRAIE